MVDETSDLEVVVVDKSLEATGSDVMEVDGDDGGSTSVKGQCETILHKPKSGRWWKNVRKEKSSSIVKVKPLKSSWEKKMKAKVDLEKSKKLQQEIREKLAAKKAAKIEAKKERERRREENARKAEIVQVIKNTQKLKKTKKKQLRSIEKRDTN